MKKLIFITLFLSITAQGEVSPCSTLESDLHGNWLYDRYIYQDQVHPRPNPRLRLHFEFYKTGTNRVWWERTNEEGFCERVGSYTYNSENCSFTDRVEWVNPNNNPECSSDPDMRQGREATSRLELKDGTLHLYFQLKGDPFIYVFEKQ